MTKHPNKLKEECRQEAYEFYHENIEPLPKKLDKYLFISYPILKINQRTSNP